jgi:hypothetical protein
MHRHRIWNSRMIVIWGGLDLGIIHRLDNPCTICWCICPCEVRRYQNPMIFDRFFKHFWSVLDPFCLFLRMNFLSFREIGRHLRYSNIHCNFLFLLPINWFLKVGFRYWSTMKDNLWHWFEDYWKLFWIMNEMLSVCQFNYFGRCLRLLVSPINHFLGCDCLFFCWTTVAYLQFSVVT